MDDAVGDVLAQRKALDRGAGAGVAVSLLVHGLIVAAAVFGALHRPQEPGTPVIEIQFAKMPAVSVPRAPVAAPVAAPVPVPTVQAPKPQPIVETPKPVAKPAPAKTAPFSPYGKS